MFTVQVRITIQYILMLNLEFFTLLFFLVFPSLQYIFYNSLEIFRYLFILFPLKILLVLE